MKTQTANLLLALGVVATLAVIGLYGLIPNKTLQIIPSEQWNTRLMLPYGDIRQSGRWVDQQRRLIHCRIEPDIATGQLCGVHTYLGKNATDGIDLSGYSTLKMTIRYEGKRGRMRLFMRNFNPAYSKAGDANSAKFISLVLDTKELNGATPVNIEASELSVADWWLDQWDLERQYQRTELTNVTAFGLDFGAYMLPADEVQFEIVDVHFEGPLIKEQHWYLGILLFWVSIIVVFLVAQYMQLKHRNRSYSQQLTQLAQDKEHFERQSQKYRQLSHLDPLTGALNRLGAEQFLESLKNGQMQPSLALMVLDIDYFKRINDRRGHDVGDSILKTVVQLIQAEIRTDDALCRWGGEEFVLITPINKTEAAILLAEKIRKIIADYTFEPSKPLKVTCSIGVTFKHSDETFEEAFKRADEALYTAKNQGRNCSILKLAESDLGK